MTSKKNENEVPVGRGGILPDEWNQFPGHRLIDKVLGSQDPVKLIREMSCQDLFLMIKRVGEDDALPLLSMASEDQWQYILDMELWDKDRMDPDKTYTWLSRLHMANKGRLAKWLLNEGRWPASLFMYSSISVLIKEPEDAPDVIPEGYQSFDGVFFIKVHSDSKKEEIQSVLKSMAEHDLGKYHALLTNLGGILPAETEEEMYRLKNVRLAEYGFLPREEALEIYSPLGLDKIARTEERPRNAPLVKDIADEEAVPVIPLYFAGSRNLMLDIFARSRDKVFLDRLRLEFAGLCNQVFSADGVSVDDIEAFIRICGKVSGYLNIVLGRLAGDDMRKAETILKDNHLSWLFRAGFGMVLQMKWDTGAWLKTAWFRAHDLEFAFWGDDKSGILRSLCADRPMMPADFVDGEEYRDFESLDDILYVRTEIERIRALDILLGRLETHCPAGEGVPKDYGGTYQSLILTFWARQVLELAPSFSPISLEQSGAFFHLLRSRDEKAPFRMSGYKGPFIDDLSECVEGEEVDKEVLCQALEVVWEEFVDEYSGIPVERMNGRFLGGMLRVVDTR